MHLRWSGSRRGPEATAVGGCGWGLGLPNRLANYAIQPIVIGSAPTLALLGLGLLLTLTQWLRREKPRPFWVGFIRGSAF